VTRKDWLLVLLALKGPAVGLDPIRVQKGMFLFAMEGGAPSTEVYEFEPYNYGPMSRAVYVDLDALVAEGLVERVPVADQRWDRYRATPRGRERAQALVDGTADQRRRAAGKLYEIKQGIVGKSFSGLLNDVYDRYPEFAERSVFQRS
jgi:hypothetical protein